MKHTSYETLVCFITWSSRFNMYCFQAIRLSHAATKNTEITSLSNNICVLKESLSLKKAACKREAYYKRCSEAREALILQGQNSKESNYSTMQWKTLFFPLHSQDFSMSPLAFRHQSGTSISVLLK